MTLMPSTRYPANIRKDTFGYLATFRDFQEANTGDNTFQATVLMAQGALITTLDMYLDLGRDIPKASAIKPGETWIYVPFGVCLKILLYNTIGIRPKL